MIRPIKLPDDLITIGKITGETWQYPENPAWSVQQDEEETLGESMENYKRLWPIIRLLGIFSPRFRDVLRGYVWEEDGQMAGFSNANRMGGSNTWYINAVGVRPAYRRRGIARKLVQTTIDYIRQRGADAILLDMTEGNLPAYELYKNLGFEVFSGSTEFVLTPGDIPKKPSLPDGYHLVLLPFKDWQPHYELENRITPEPLRKYEPVDESRYKRAPLSGLIRPILLSAEDAVIQDYLVRSNDGEIVAKGGYYYRERETGRNSIDLILDPAKPELADFLVGFLLHEVISKSPQLKVELSVPRWQGAVAAAAQNAGFEERLKGLRMGLVL
jgi:GNAT superfamily N-acetyltransferase